jgi:hypothetical protein
MKISFRFALAAVAVFVGLGRIPSAEAATHWANQGTKCEGTRRVDFARLWGLAPGTNWVGICKRTKAVNVSSRANGKVPSTCVQKADGSVWGEWNFSNHASCRVPAAEPLHWADIGHKCENGALIEYARLWGLGPGTDWPRICSRTKASNVSQLSDGKVPSNCVDKGVGGVWGEWKYSNHSSCAARWGDFKKDRCVATGYRQWSSRLWDAGSNAAETCSRTKAVVSGQAFDRPSRCKDLGAGGVWGEFDVRDASCPFWGNELGKPGLVRGGCSAVNIRKYYARLWDIADGVDWNTACHAESASIGGRSGGPSRCVNKGPLGMWGEWLVEDKACTVDKLPQDSRREATARAKLDEIRDVILAKAGIASNISKDAAVSRELKRGDANRIASAARAAEGGEAQPDGNLLRTVTVGAVVETKLIFVGGSAEAGAAIDMTGHRPVYAYASAGYAWGPALAAGGGVNVGFWVCQNNKIGGDSWGWTLGLDDIALGLAKKNPFGKGASVAVGLWFSYPNKNDPNSRDEFQGFTITPGYGVGADFVGLNYATTAVDGDDTVTCDGRPAQ